MSPEPIDLHHLGRERIIASYLLDTDDGPALFDCGPSTTIDALKAGLADRGLALDRRPAPAAQPHPPRPRRRGRRRSCASTRRCRCTSRRSARRTSSTRRGWSRARAGSTATRSTRSGASSLRCRAENVHIVGDRVLGLDCFPTPGHASHHVCYLDPDGTLYAGDACGVRVLPGRFVMPPTPPPEVDVEAWEETIDEIERRAPERLALIHFGVAEDVAAPSHRAATQPARLGRVRSRAARRRRSSSSTRTPSSPTRARTRRPTTSRCRSGSPTAASRAGPRSGSRACQPSPSASRSGR